MIPIKLTNDTWPPKDGEFCSSIVLYYDNWNDYSYRTSFVMCYCDADGMVREVGNVKIYYWQNDEVRTNQYSEQMLSVINKISERGGNLLATEDFLTIDALYHERPLTEKMQARLNRLIEMGIVEHIGRKKYVLARSLYAATGKTGVHTRRVGLDRDTNKELLLKHIRQNNEVGTPFKELQQVLPGLNRNQIQDLMKELKKGGKVFCEGRTSAARWFAIN